MIWNILELPQRWTMDVSLAQMQVLQAMRFHRLPLNVYHCSSVVSAYEKAQAPQPCHSHATLREGWWYVSYTSIVMYRHILSNSSLPMVTMVTITYVIGANWYGCWVCDSWLSDSAGTFWKKRIQVNDWSAALRMSLDDIYQPFMHQCQASRTRSGFYGLWLQFLATT